MSIRRIFIGTENIIGNKLTLTDTEILHRLQKVLRLNVSDRIRIFDKSGNEALARIIESTKHALELEILETYASILSPLPEINIYQALTKPIGKFEDMLQKATELGAHGFTPILTTHTENKILSKTSRLETILIGASEQCGRSDIPTLKPLCKFTEILKNPPMGLNLLTYEKETVQSLAQLLSKIKKSATVNVFIGPEGGWDIAEIELARERKFEIVGLGKIILRTETVAPAILSAIYLS